MSIVAVEHMLMINMDKIGVVEWCWTLSFDPSNIDHCRLSESIQISSGISNRPPEERTIQAACTAFSKLGMSVLHCEDLASHNDRIPWYSPIERAVADPHISWSTMDDELCPLFGGMSRDTAALLLQAAKWQVCAFDIISFIALISTLAIYAHRTFCCTETNIDYGIVFWVFGTSTFPATGLWSLLLRAIIVIVISYGVASISSCDLAFNHGSSLRLQCFKEQLWA